MPVGSRESDLISQYTQTYSTFSGCDIVATFNGTTIGNLAAITWSVSREKAPIFTLGSANARSFSRGKRGIAGSMIFTVFDRMALYELVAAEATREDRKIWVRDWNTISGLGGSLVQVGLIPIDADYSTLKQVTPYYADQVLPFDVTITYANEYGQAAVKTIYGVELLNEGSGVSMDDIVIEETMTFVAREVGPMIPTARSTDAPFSTVSGTFDENVVNGLGI